MTNETENMALLQEVARGTEMGKNTLEQMLPLTEDRLLRAELLEEQRGYRTLNQRAHTAIAALGGETEGAGSLEKLGAKMGILSRTLDIDVERRHDINAVDRSHLFIGTARDIAAVSRALAYERTVRAGQKLVVLLFETSQAVVVYIHYTQHLRCQIAVWIYALHGLLKKHAG